MTISRIQRNTFIITLWTILYFWWFSWYMERNWTFEIFQAKHWQILWDQWWYGGWVIQGSYHWIFFFSLILCIPVWIWTTCFWLKRHYTKFFEKAFWDSIYKRKTKAIHSKDTRIRVKKKKSYTEIRPQPLAATPQPVAPVQPMSAHNTATNEASVASNAGEDSFAPFNLPEENASDVPSFEMPEVVPLNEDFVSIMQQAGAAVISNPKIGEQKLDYLAVGKNDIYYILLDAEKGNWLADEERFNDEDPLWYSEEPIRVSPITTIKKFEQTVEEKLSKLDIKMNGHIILVKTDGNIINVEDMQDTWKEMGVLVARSNVGMPEELPSFAEVFPSTIEQTDRETVDKIGTIFES